MNLCKCVHLIDGSPVGEIPIPRESPLPKLTIQWQDLHDSSQSSSSLVNKIYKDLKGRASSKNSGDNREILKKNEDRPQLHYSFQSIIHILPLAMLRWCNWLHKGMAPHSDNLSADASRSSCNSSSFLATFCHVLCFLFALRVVSCFVHFHAPARSAIFFVQICYHTFSNFSSKLCHAGG